MGSARGVTGGSARLVGAADGRPIGRQKRRVDDLRRRPGQHAVCAARSDQRGQLQQARDRLAVQDRQPGPAARVPVRIDAADGPRRRLLDRRHPAGGRRARRGHRRAAVDAQRARRRARRGSAPAALGPRPGVLDRRPRRADSLRHAGLPPHRARRKDRQSDPELRHGRSRRSEAERRSDDGPRHRRDWSALRADRCRQHGHRRRRALVGRRAAQQDQREGLHPRVRRQDRQAVVDLPHDSTARRVRQRHLAERLVVLHRQRRFVGTDLGR